MKRIVLSLFFLVCVNAYANPFLNVVTESDDIVILVDAKSVIKVGDYVRAWVIFNFSKPETNHGFKYISENTLYFFDCDGKEMGKATRMLFAGKNATGESVTTFSIPVQDIELGRVEPNSMGDILLKNVCQRLPTAKSLMPRGR